MIRYYLDAGISQIAAAQCAHPSLARLRGRGPWTAIDSGCIQRGQAQSWGEIKPGIGGLRYQLADPMPPIMQAISVRDTGPIAWVDLPGGIRLPVKLAAYSPVAIRLDGTTGGPSDEYGLTAARLWDRLQAGDLPVLDPELISFCRLALMSQTNLTEELCHAYGLITTESVSDIFDAASGVPKAEAGGGS